MKGASSSNAIHLRKHPIVRPNKDEDRAAMRSGLNIFKETPPPPSSHPPSVLLDAHTVQRMIETVAKAAAGAAVKDLVNIYNLPRPPPLEAPGANLETDFRLLLQKWDGQASAAVERERIAREEAQQQVAVERTAREEAQRQLVVERTAREESQRQLVVERKAREDAQRQLVVERTAREEAQRQLVVERTAREEAQRQLVVERTAREEAVERERTAREEAVERERTAREEAQQQVVVERKAREEAVERERTAREEAQQQVAVERKAREEAVERERTAREEAEAVKGGERTARETGIPAHVYQTWHTKDISLLPQGMQDCIYKLRGQNPEFTFHLFDDDDCREFLRQYFDADVLQAYDDLIPGAFKSDLWRYCMLYKHGGVYLDIKYYCCNGFKLASLLDGPDFYVADIVSRNKSKNTFESRDPNQPYAVYQAVFGCRPGSAVIRDCISTTVENVKHRRYSNCSLGITGPTMMGKLVVSPPYRWNPLMWDLGHLGEGRVYSRSIGKEILQIYKDYRSDQSATQKTVHYDRLWRSKRVFATSVWSHDIPRATIPPYVYQTWHTNDIPLLPPGMQDCIYKLRGQNPEFTFHLFDDDDCREFLRQYFDADVLQAYDDLVPGAFKSDLWRYCMLYKHGGVYLDIKYACCNDFKLVSLLDGPDFYVSDIVSLNKSKNTFEIMNREEPHAVYQAVFGCRPGSRLLRDCILKTVENVKQRYYGCSFLDVTGPIMMGKLVSSPPYNTKHTEWDLGNYDAAGTIYSRRLRKEVLRIYDTYRAEQRNTQTKPHYGDLWREKKIYTTDH
jgi:mannosyltransferase OCH1-like enzyme